MVSLPMRTWSPTTVRCLCDAVVVDEDRRRADVGALADRGVADVGQVRHLDAVADPRRSWSRRTSPILPPAPSTVPGPQVGERADAWRRRRSRRRQPWVRTTLAPAPTIDVDQRGVRADHRAGADRGSRRAAGCSGCDRRRRGSSATSTSIQVVAGSTTVTPARIQSRRVRSRMSRAAAAASWTRSLTPAVSGASPVRVRRRPAARRRRADRDDVGEVLLALGVVGRRAGQRLAQQRGVEGVDAGVDLADGALVGASASRCSTMRGDLAVAGRARPGRSRSGRRPRRSARSRPPCVLRRARRRARPASSRVSSGASPGSTTTVPVERPGSASSAIRTAWPVPRCSSWTTGTAAGAISRQVGARPARRRGRRPRRSARRRAAPAAASTWPSRVRPPSGCSTLGGGATSSACPRRRPGRSRAHGRGCLDGVAAPQSSLGATRGPRQDSNLDREAPKACGLPLPHTRSAASAAYRCADVRRVPRLVASHRRAPGRSVPDEDPTRRRVIGLTRSSYGEPTLP